MLHSSTDRPETIVPHRLQLNPAPSRGIPAQLQDSDGAAQDAPRTAEPSGSAGKAERGGEATPVPATAPPAGAHRPPSASGPTSSAASSAGRRGIRALEWQRTLPLLLLHLGVLGVIWVGWSPIAVAVAVALYFARMFAVTGFYHRYFSHRTFKANRFWQLAFATAGASAVQRGPLWWAAHHRHHHASSDRPDDVHSPVQHGFFWSHMGWIMDGANSATNLKAVPDLAKYPELRFLDRWEGFIPALLAASLFGLGAILERTAPGLGTSGLQMVVWGFFVSTVLLFHGTSSINSLAHRMGRRRYATRDDSRNSWILAFVTLGEGWHNNHHHYPASTRQGFYWWEIDITYAGLRLLERLRIVRDLKPVPPRVLEEGRRAEANSIPSTDSGRSPARA